VETVVALLDQLKGEIDLGGRLNGKGFDDVHGLILDSSK
jgi:hypothetical protein